MTRSKGLLLPDVQQENYSLEMRHDDIGKVLYRRMEKSEEGKDDALEGAVEHEVVDRLMEDLSRSRVSAQTNGRLVAPCSRSF